MATKFEDWWLGRHGPGPLQLTKAAFPAMALDAFRGALQAVELGVIKVEDIQRIILECETLKINSPLVRGE